MAEHRKGQLRRDPSDFHSDRRADQEGHLVKGQRAHIQAAPDHPLPSSQEKIGGEAIDKNPKTKTAKILQRPRIEGDPQAAAFREKMRA